MSQVILAQTMNKSHQVMYHLQFQNKVHVISKVHFEKLLGLYRDNTDKYSHEHDPLFVRNLCIRHHPYIL
ncbi:hypothetical protein EON65_45435 [archaeon]|nr:MAG: hypothetical protein EON65_45435 [archaeon]